MTALVPAAEQLRQLEQDTRQAWSGYRAGLRELSGAEYERAEAESWIELRTQLSRLELRRRALTHAERDW